MSKSSSPPSPITSAIKPQDYVHSPVHFAVSLGDHKTLKRLLSTLPKLTDPSQIHTESDSLAQEKIADQIVSVVDRRDVPNRETPLHLAVRLNDSYAARSLVSAGADVSLQNSAGWSPLQESICRRNSDISLTLVRFHHRSSWAKWRRRLPRLISVLHRMRDFYMEISFHFESSVIPFVGKIAPSDTYKIWKRDGNVRADTSIAGFDGLKIQRSDQSFLFLGDGNAEFDVSSGSLLVLNHNERKVFDAFENAGGPMTEADVTGFCAQTSVYRPGMDVTKAELVGRTNWRRQEKMESVGEWKAKVYEIHNVVFSFRSRRISGDPNEVLPLELDEDEEGFLVAENPKLDFPNGRRHSSFVREDREFISVGRRSVDILPPVLERRRQPLTTPLPLPPAPATKEKEYVKNLRPSVWLTEQFPLKIEELLPLLDILANKVKAVRRLREVLTTKFPPGTFPVKVAIPVLPTVRVVVTFTKFVDLQPAELFFTPLSSPRHFLPLPLPEDKQQRQQKQMKQQQQSEYYTTTTSWLRRTNSKQNQRCSAIEQLDPFIIPSDYTWTSIDDKPQTTMKKSKSTRNKSK